MSAGEAIVSRSGVESVIVLAALDDPAVPTGVHP
jgi:hypothetical protein